MGCQAMSGVLLLGLLLVGVMNVAAQTPDCTQYLTDLATCQGYLTNTAPTPGATCCSGISTVEKDSVTCLCYIVSQLSSSGTSVNLTRAYEIPKDCNIAFSNSSCSATGTTGPSPTASTPATGASPSPVSGASAPVNPGAGSMIAPSLFTVFGAMALSCVSIFSIAVGSRLTAV